MDDRAAPTHEAHGLEGVVLLAENLKFASSILQKDKQAAVLEVILDDDEALQMFNARTV